MELYPKKCPCGCKKVILYPICWCQCSSVSAEEAHELMVRVNKFEILMAALENIVCGNDAGAAMKNGVKILRSIKRQLKAKPKFPEYS